MFFKDAKRLFWLNGTVTCWSWRAMWCWIRCGRKWWGAWSN